ncbi:MAG: DUF2723 domain-containing protein [Gemmatimonadaceae bacterium]
MGTLAPGLTMWDAGEFIAAVRTFGIPHQPGTPLYVMLARTWTLAMPFASTALATNLFSAVCTAAAGGLLALFIARILDSRAMAIAGALCAGGMFTVWSSATETEVYASVLLLVMLTLLAAERAGRGGDGRWRAVTAYALVLAVPLHLGALVAAPAAVLLVAEREDGSFDGRSGARLAAVVLCAAGLGLASVSVTAAGALAIAIIVMLDVRDAHATRETFATLACALLAISALAVLVVRARFDPWLNEGAPANLRALWEVIGRRQYGAGGMWPRQAPLWAQVANWFEYADWQVALGASNGVAPSWWRTPVTLAFAALGIVGSRAHLRTHARSWRALATLFVCASAGLIVYLNFKAGASFGFGVLADSAPHEVRDRDYFFVLSFWVWGAWAGIGAVALACRLGAQWIPVGVLAAAAPLALNAPAADRRGEPERSVAIQIARALLASAPSDAVLVTGGDNDSFPAWYAQAVEGVRPDVTVVVAPLLGTRWYRAQLARRDSLVAPADVDPTRSSAAMIAAVARLARARGRPVVASLMTPVETRDAIGGLTVARGLLFAEATAPESPTVVKLGGEAPSSDTLIAREMVRDFPLASFTPRSGEETGIDPAAETFLAYLRCPSQYLSIARSGIAVSSLDSVCKLR